MEHNKKKLSLYQHTSWASTLFILPCVVWLPDLDGLDVAESHSNFVAMMVSEVSVLEKQSVLINKFLSHCKEWAEIM